MTPGFEKAFAAFRNYAAARNKVQQDKVEVGPVDEAGARGFPWTVGRAWGFDAVIKGERRHVRGWATADGTIVTPEQNLRIFLEEAGLWDIETKLSADEIAELILWAINDHQHLDRGGPQNIPPPTIQKNADGSGTLRFIANRQPPGSWIDHREYVIAFTADHQVTLSTREVEFDFISVRR